MSRMSGRTGRQLGAGWVWRVSAGVWVTLAMSMAACGGGGDSGGGAVTAPPVAVGSVAVTLPAGQLQAGAQLTASADVRSAAGAALSGRVVAWSSSNSAVATVTDGGVVTGVAPGSVSITATSEGRSGSASLTVVPAPVTTVVVSAPSTTLVTARTLQAAVQLRDERGNTLAGRAVTWSSSAPTVATVNETGLVTGVSSGTVTITATSEGRSGTLSLAVVPPPVATVSVSLRQSTIPLGTTTTATAVMRDDRNEELPGRAVIWSSGNPAVATVSLTGVVTAISTGTAVVSATSEGQSGSATVTVIRPPVATVNVSLAQSSVLPGQSVQAAAQAVDAAGTTLVGRDITWSSSNSAVASVTATGLVTAVSVGTTNIVATSEGRSGQVTFTVRSPIASVTVSGSSRVKVGDLYTYTTIARAADGSIVDRPVVWGVRESGRALVTQSGALTPLQPGSFTLVARIDGEDWVTTPTAYDWEAFASGGNGFITLDADVRVANRVGTLEYPELVVSCAPNAPFFLWVRTPHIITDNGVVAMSFDGGTPVGDVWRELSPEFRTLWKPGSSSTVFTFAQRVASHRLFGFAFGEFNGTTKATFFRVTGMASVLRAMVNTYCPTFASLRQGGTGATESSALDMQRALESRVRAAGGGGYEATLSEEAQARAQRGPASSSSPLLNAWPTWSTPPEMPARRERR
jgi:uncharacterized protein YjdB